MTLLYSHLDLLLTSAGVTMSVNTESNVLQILWKPSGAAWSAQSNRW